MKIEMLKAKIHRAVVTETDLNYNGSISIDSELLEQSGILPYEKVDVLNITNGSRFTTYAIAAVAGSKKIGINGAAAHLVNKDDLVIICAYISCDAQEAKLHQPKIILVDEHNNIVPHG